MHDAKKESIGVLHSVKFVDKNSFWVRFAKKSA